MFAPRAGCGFKNAAAVALAALLGAGAAQGQLSAELVGRLGFRDARHTGSDGLQWSEVLAISDRGFTVGISERFVGPADPLDPEALDMSAWMGDPWGGTRSIGLYDAIHTSATGLHTSEIVDFTRSGYAVGHSIRYSDPSGRVGRTAWVAGPDRVTRRVGLYYTGSEPGLSEGWPENTLIDVNEAGQSVGTVEASTGSFAWQANADGTTRRIGILDLTAADAEVRHEPVEINPSGTVLGNTTVGPNSIAWVQRKNGGRSVQIGLHGEDYVGADNATVNRAVAINDHGVVIGNARRGPPLYPGSDAYLYEPWVWIPVGDTQSLDTDSHDGSTALFLTNSGLVGGTQMREGRSADTRAWIYDIRTRTRRSVGMSDPEWDPPDALLALTESGIAVGVNNRHRESRCWMALPGQPAQRIDPTGPAYDWGMVQSAWVVGVAANGYTIGTSRMTATGGQSAWLASPADASTRLIGLADGTYTGGSKNGHDLRTSVPTHVTSSGFVAGYSLRYHWDFTAEGQTAWVYNSEKDRYVKFVFSARPSDGYAFSQVHALLENGIAVGSYRKFGDDGSDLGDRAFVWVTGRGAYDLGSILDVDPAEAGWEHLARGVVVNAAGILAGHGVPAESASQGVFLARLE